MHLDGFRPSVACIIIQLVMMILRRMSLQMDLYMFTMTDDRQPWIWNNTGQIITYLHSSVLTVAVFSFNSTPYCKIVNIAVEIWQSSALWICHRRRLPDFFRKTSGNMRNSSQYGCPKTRLFQHNHMLVVSRIDSVLLKSYHLNSFLLNPFPPSLLRSLGGRTRNWVLTFWYLKLAHICTII